MLVNSTTSYRLFEEEEEMADDKKNVEIQKIEEMIRTLQK